MTDDGGSSQHDADEKCAGLCVLELERHLEASGLMCGLTPLQPQGALGISPGADSGPSVLSRGLESGHWWRVPFALQVAPQQFLCASTSGV